MSPGADLTPWTTKRSGLGASGAGAFRLSGLARGRHVPLVEFAHQRHELQQQLRTIRLAIAHDDGRAHLGLVELDEAYVLAAEALDGGRHHTDAAARSHQPQGSLQLARL